MIVSIVIPCFNHARFLGEAIDSARRQGWPELEVVVVDDGSTDGSRDIASRFDDVRVIRKPNGGLARARNTGMSSSRGDVLIFLDADDRLRDGAVRAAVDAFSAAPDAAMVFGSCQLIDARGQRLLTNVPVVRDRYYEELLRRNYIWTPAMAAFRRRAIDNVGGFDPRVNASADYDMYLRIARQYPVVRHDAIVADYRQHGGNMSSNPVLMLKTTLAVMAAQRRFVGSDPRLRAAYHDGVENWRAFYGEHLVERFRSALHEGRPLQMFRDAVHLLRLYPRGAAFHLRKKARLLRAARRVGTPG